MRANQRTEFEWRRVVAIASALALAAALIAFGVTGCGGGSSGGGTLVVDAPGTPTAFTVERTPEATLSATLTWSSPTTGGDPATFEIYRSTTAGTAFLPDNHVISMPVVSGQTTPYTFIDDAGLTPVDTYWVVSAKNVGGETASAEVMYKPIGSGGGEDEGYGNNFSAALVFADDIGIGGLAIGATSVWTNDLTTPIDYNTGLRPTLAQVTALAALPVPVTTMPYLDPATTFLLGGVTYYKQQTASTWQGQWERGAGTLQEVTAKWGDNLISQRFTSNSVVRIEMVLSKTLTTPMTSYTMQSLYGSQRNEIFGTSGVAYDNLSAFVFAANARMKIQKLDGATNPVLYDRRLWDGDGPGFLGAEINVGGNFTYGFVWMLNQEVLPPAIPTKTGTWRITFSLDGTSPKGTSNNTSITTATNGVLVSSTEVYIDIVVQ